jgi:hypothetical protein
MPYEGGCSSPMSCGDSDFKVEQNDKVKKIVLLKPLVGFAKEKKLKKLLSGWKNVLHFSILFYNKIK